MICLQDLFVVCLSPSSPLGQDLRKPHACSLCVYYISSMGSIHVPFAQTGRAAIPNRASSLYPTIRGSRQTQSDSGPLCPTLQVLPVKPLSLTWQERASTSPTTTSLLWWKTYIANLSKVIFSQLSIHFGLSNLFYKLEVFNQLRNAKPTLSCLLCKSWRIVSFLTLECRRYVLWLCW